MVTALSLRVLTPPYGTGIRRTRKFGSTWRTACSPSSWSKGHLLFLNTWSFLSPLFDHTYLTDLFYYSESMEDGPHQRRSQWRYKSSSLRSPCKPQPSSWWSQCWASWQPPSRPRLCLETSELLHVSHDLALGPSETVWWLRGQWGPGRSSLLKVGSNRGHDTWYCQRSTRRWPKHGSSRNWLTLKVIHIQWIILTCLPSNPEAPVTKTLQSNIIIQEPKI